MKFTRLMLITAVVFVIAMSAQAQDATPPVTPEATAAVVAYVPPSNLPPTARLTGLRPVYQLFNRCAAGALTIDLSYYGWKGTYTNTITYLNPNENDVAVRMDEMATFAEQQGLKAVYRNGGTIDLLKALVASGFPVLIKNAYYEGANPFQDFMGHNRVVMGYDDSKQEVLTFDSLLGNGPDDTGRPISYTDLESRWRIFNRDFLVLYHPEDEAKVEQIMGSYWDPTYGNEIALQQSQQELDSPTPDSYTLFNMGSSLVELGHYDEAAADFDKARSLGLPWRMMWYQYGPFEAYYQTKRYDDVIKLAQSVLATTPGVEEAYYYAGLAYQAEGDLTRAKTNFQTAIFYNKNYAEAKDALAKMGA